MANYTKVTNFASKDALLTGNPSKLVRGSEIDAEFNNIATAISTKADSNNATLTGTPTAPTAAAGTSTTQLATTAFVAGLPATDLTFTGMQTFRDNKFEITDNTDITKKVAFNVADVSTGTTRTLLIPNKNGTIAITSDFAPLNVATNTAVSGTYSASSTSTITITATHNFTVGQEVRVTFTNTSGSALTNNNFTIVSVTGTTEFTINYGSSVTSAGTVLVERYGLVAVANATEMLEGTSAYKVLSVKQFRDFNLIAGTAQSPTGTNTVTFSSIPSWAKRITIVFSNISCTGGGSLDVRVGSGSTATSGYLTITGRISTSPSTSNVTDSISNVGITDSTTQISGICIIAKVGGNTWAATGNYSRYGDAAMGVTSGTITLGGALDRVVIATTANYDAGTINIMYE